MIKILEELSKILAEVGIYASSSKKERVLNAIRNIDVSLEVTKELEFYESQEDLDSSSNHFFQPKGETEEPYNACNGKPTL